MMLRWIPNILTFIRLILIIPFLMMLKDGQYQYAFYIFLIAGFTDGLDGWMARYFHWQTLLGSVIDPMADKLLVSTSFLALALLNVLPWWLIMLVIARDITISTGVFAWVWVVRKPIKFKPTMLSKINTTLQLALVTVCLYQLAFLNLPNLIIPILIFATAVTTAISYIDYVWIWSKKASSNEPSS